MQPLAVGSEERDELDGTVAGSEPVGRPRAELDGFSRLDREVFCAEHEAQTAIQDESHSWPSWTGSSSMSGGVRRFALTRIL